MRAKKRTGPITSSPLNLDKKVRVRRLSNGMKAVVCENREVSQAYVVAMFKAGSRFETLKDNGLTHVLEHMVFRGAGSYRDSRALNEAAEDIGGMLEAATYRDLVTFSTGAHRSEVRKAIDIVGALVSAPKFQNIETEKAIICEEVLESLDARGRMIDIDNVSHRLVFGKHPLAKPIEGTLENVKSFSVRDLRRYQEQIFNGGNGVVAVSVSRYSTELWEWLEDAFGSLPPGRALAFDAPQFPKMGAYQHVRNTGSQVELRVSYQGISPYDPDYPAMVLLNRILGEGMSSRIQTELIDRLGLAYSLFGSSTTYVDCGTYDFDCSVAPAKFMSCFKELLAFARRATKARYSAAEIDRARRRHLYAIEFMADSPAEMTLWYGRHHLYELPQSLSSLQASLDQVDAKALRRVAKRVFAAGPCWAVSIGPLTKEIRREAAELAETLRISN